MLYSAYQHRGLTAVRYPRGATHGADARQEMREIPLGKAEIVRRGRGVAILCFGTLLETALQVGEEINATVVNMRFVKPLDEELISEMAATHDLLVTLEENAIAGGAGSGVNEHLATQELSTPILNLGLPDRYIDHGSQDQQLAACGLDKDGIIGSIKKSSHFTEVAEIHAIDKKLNQKLS
jgi:1-deoxy-D-xylulose-5-phosphate synthase